MPPFDPTKGPRETVRTRAGGRDWELARCGDLESLWQAMGEEDGGFADDERLPYWCEIWPSSIALADWIAENAARLAGRRCLDLGCGLGLTALAGAAAGARVLAMDYEWPAVAFARDNARANLAPGPAPAPLFTLMDWRAPAVRAGSVDFVWGGDVLYEKRFAEPVAAFLDHVLAPRGEAWIAEPGREVYQCFPETARRRALTARRLFTRTVPSAYTDRTAGPPATVHVWAVNRSALQPQA
ncbi:MAG: methyltransferase domain-containing protein [Desulfovibrionaceae bacterium]|jgi:predicted nicotinamide N-methyase|nr:methyltransferase domain-containing protein [Desulfovibrionaceae bacterium]